MRRSFLRLKFFFCLLFFFCQLVVFGSQASLEGEPIYYSSVRETHFFDDSDCIKKLTRIVKNYSKKFGIDFFKISEGKRLSFGIYDSGKSFVSIDLKGNLPYLEVDNLEKDKLDIAGKEYQMWYDLGKGLILLGDDKLVLSDDFGKFLSEAENYEKKAYLSGNLEILGDEQYEYFTYERVDGKLYGCEYNRKLLVGKGYEKETSYFLKGKKTTLSQLDLAGYIPKDASVESSPGDAFLKKLLFGGLAGVEVDQQFLKDRLEELKPLVTYRVNWGDKSYLLVYANGVEKLKKTMKDIYSSIFYYRDLEISGKDRYSFVELPLFEVKKYFLELGDNLFVLANDVGVVDSIKNGEYSNSRYSKVDLNICNFGDELMRFYEDKIVVIER